MCVHFVLIRIYRRTVGQECEHRNVEDVVKCKELFLLQPLAKDNFAGSPRGVLRNV